MEPVPKHVPQVLAIWNPLSMTNVRVPVPWHELQVARFAPRLRPVPLHVEQVETGLMFTVRTVPLQASIKVTLTRASISAPRELWVKPAERARPPKVPPKSWENKSPCAPPKAAPKSRNPAKPPVASPKGFRANAFGSKPGC